MFVYVPIWDVIRSLGLTRLSGQALVHLPSAIRLGNNIDDFPIPLAPFPKEGGNIP